MEWRPVIGFPGYSVSELGQVRKDAFNRLLNPRINQYGVPYVGMMREWRQHIRSLPRLVATAFLPETNEVFDTPINLDGNRMNCSVDNLMWRPRAYAVKYLHQFREPYEYPITEPIRAIETGEEFPNSLATAMRYGLLEREVVYSVVNRTPAWPTYQTFELVNWN